jgi:3-(3-hydroxy-phenyl)propionate hydroxylase
VDGGGWFLDKLGGRFTGVWFSPDGAEPEMPAIVRQALAAAAPAVNQVAVVSRETIAARYGAEHQPAYYLFRPDGHVAARWRNVTADRARAALHRSLARA